MNDSEWEDYKKLVGHLLPVNLLELEKKKKIEFDKAELGENVITIYELEHFYY